MANGIPLATDHSLYQGILYFQISCFKVHASFNFIYDLSRSQILRQHYVHISYTGPHKNLKTYVESTDRNTFTPVSEESLLLLRMSRN